MLFQYHPHATCHNFIQTPWVWRISFNQINQRSTQAHARLFELHIHPGVHHVFHLRRLKHSWGWLSTIWVVCVCVILFFFNGLSCCRISLGERNFMFYECSVLMWMSFDCKMTWLDISTFSWAAADHWGACITPPPAHRNKELIGPKLATRRRC